MKPYCEAMRLGRWPRSMAIFVGCSAFLFFHREFLSEYSIYWFLSQSLLAFLLTWGISTANYIINEIADAPYDIHHPTKQDRPLVRGEINKTFFLMLGISIAFVSLLVAFLLFSRPFLYSLLALLIAGFVYNIKPVRTKDIPFLDSISESANNPIRFFIGWFAFAPNSIFPSLSLLLSWWAFGNFLMVAKRLSEFRFLKEKAGDYRSSMKKYSKTSLVVGMAASAVLFFIAYFVFAFTFKLQSFIYLSPLVLFFFFQIFKKTLREKEVMEEPERLFTHSFFSIYTLLMVAVFLVFSFLDSVGR